MIPKNLRKTVKQPEKATRKIKVYTKEFVEKLKAENKRIYAYWQEDKELKAEYYTELMDLKSKIETLEESIDKQRMTIMDERRNSQRQLLDIIRWHINPETAKELKKELKPEMTKIPDWLRNC